MGGSGMNKQASTSAAVETQPGEERGPRPRADGPGWRGHLPSSDPEPRRCGAAWLHSAVAASAC